MSEPPVETPPPDEPGEATAEAAPHCWRCGSPHDRFQEYCLECGARLVPLAARRGWRRQTWTRDSPFWFWATFLALLLTALVAGAIVLAATRDSEPSRNGEGAAPGPTTSVLQEIPTLPTTETVTTSPLPDTVTIPPPTSPVPTLPPPTPPPADGTPPPPAGATPPPPAATPPPTPPPAGGTGALRTWPSGRSGYTVILTSVPHSQGRPAAEQRAREATAKGVSDVGVLNSSDYGSLRKGYYVVFSGVYDTAQQAMSQLGSVRQAGYPVAYVREIAP